MVTFSYFVIYVSLFYSLILNGASAVDDAVEFLALFMETRVYFSSLFISQNKLGQLFILKNKCC